MLKVAYIAPELGAVTSTFVYREIEALRQRGLDVALFSTHRPKSTVISQEAQPFVDETVYLYAEKRSKIAPAVASMALRHPLRFLTVLLLALRDVALAKTPAAIDRPKILWHFMVACLLARHLEECGAHHIHAHFAHVPAALAMYAAGLAGIPFSFTAHANDIFERGTALKEKVSRSAFAACISEYNVRFLEALGCDSARLCIVHCGLDTTHHPLRPPTAPQSPPVLLSVGRFVEKKGFPVLLDALADLRARGAAFHCDIVGDGPLFDAMQKRVEEEGLAECVTLLGSLPQEAVQERLARGDAFVLPCVVASGGDRDGIPVVLMEAMARGVPVVSTTVSGIPELVHSGKNGLLVPPQDAEALADALGTLIADAECRRRYAEEGRKMIETEFSSEVIAARLHMKFEQAVRGAQ